MKNFLFGALIALLLATTAVAQSTIDLHGRVTDERKATITGAEVSLRSRSGAEMVTWTDDNGDYRFKGLPAGDYVIEVKARGFAVFTSKALHVTRGQALANDIELAVEAVNGTVVVTLFLCAVSLAGAVFLILELDRPFTGMIQIPSETLRQAMALLGR